MEGVSDKLDMSKALGSISGSDLLATIVFFGMAGILFWVGRKEQKD
jgi:hypothetical protein